MILAAWILTIIFGTLVLGSFATLLLNGELDNCKKNAWRVILGLSLVMLVVVIILGIE